MLFWKGIKVTSVLLVLVVCCGVGLPAYAQEGAVGVLEKQVDDARYSDYPPAMYLDIAIEDLARWAEKLDADVMLPAAVPEGFTITRVLLHMSEADAKAAYEAQAEAPAIVEEEYGVYERWEMPESAFEDFVSAVIRYDDTTGNTVHFRVMNIPASDELAQRIVSYYPEKAQSAAWPDIDAADMLGNGLCLVPLSASGTHYYAMDPEQAREAYTLLQAQETMDVLVYGAVGLHYTKVLVPLLESLE